MWPMVIITLYPVWEITCMYYFRDRLDDPFIRSRIGEMYKNVNLQRNRNVVLFRPVHLIRQASFVIIPVVLHFCDSGQIELLILLNMSYLVFYAHYKPEIGTARKQFIEKFNEFLLVICSYNLMFYTYFILSLEVQYNLGYSFVLTVVIVLFVNILNLIWVVLNK